MTNLMTGWMGSLNLCTNSIIGNCWRAAFAFELVCTLFFLWMIFMSWKVHRDALWWRNTLAIWLLDCLIACFLSSRFFHGDGWVSLPLSFSDDPFTLMIYMIPSCFLLCKIVFVWYICGQNWLRKAFIRARERNFYSFPPPANPI